MYRLGSARLASTKQLAVVSTATAKLSTCTSDYKINITRCTNLPVAQRTNVITRRETMRILCLVFRRSEVRHSVISTYMCNNVCRSAIMYFSGYNLVSYCSYFLCTVTHRPVTCEIICASPLPISVFLLQHTGVLPVHPVLMVLQFHGSCLLSLLLLYVPLIYFSGRGEEGTRGH